MTNALCCALCIIVVFSVRQHPFSMPSLPPVLCWLLVANVVGFLTEQFFFPQVMRYFALWPMGDQVLRTANGLFAVPSFHVWQLLSYGFLHANISHIFFNMFGLWMFGRAIEHVWGGQRFLLYYLVCVIGAGICQLLTVSFLGSGSVAPTIGASGGVFGILLAFGMMFPNARVMLLIPPIPMAAKWLVIGYGALELFFGVTGTDPGVAHFAHLGGMAFGLVLILYWRRQAMGTGRR